MINYEERFYYSIYFYLLSSIHAFIIITMQKFTNFDLIG